MNAHSPEGIIQRLTNELKPHLALAFTHIYWSELEKGTDKAVILSGSKTPFDLLGSLQNRFVKCG